LGAREGDRLKKSGFRKNPDFEKQARIPKTERETRRK
jgi:hypothetical protein